VSLSREERIWLRREVSRRRLAQLAGESRAKRPAAVRLAMAWLEEHLSRGPRQGVDVKAAAARDGISEQTLRRATEALGVLKTNGGPSGSTWRLP
jgi:hypothetical protein